MLQAFLLGLCGAYGHLDWGIGTPYLNRPIILGPLVGLILGDFTTGIVIGATLEVFFLGQMAIGSYIPPDAAVGGVLGTAFAINAGPALKWPSPWPSPSPLLPPASRTCCGASSP